MAMSRERKVYAAVVLVAGAVLAVDRGFFGVTGASSAHAAEAEIVPLTARTAKPAAQVPTLATRLKQLGSVPRTVDLLEVTLQRTVPVEIAELPAATPVEDSRQQFASTHHLSAIASTGRSANAVINGRAVTVGEVIAGFTLTEVTREGAVFSGPGGLVELHLPPVR
ncbi:MAG: hypothetical protein KF691_11280 [Phycisphaeraceae bacterium]|nr:hypothetical protein [Phycisphaeraceae bacterium]